MDRLIPMIKKEVLVQRFFATETLIILAELVMGVLAALLVKQGNPTNLGVCVACFIQDITSALGLHLAGAVQYISREFQGSFWVASQLLAGYGDGGSLLPPPGRDTMIEALKVGAFSPRGGIGSPGQDATEPTDPFRNMPALSFAATFIVAGIQPCPRGQVPL